jgi:hypothetical protein
VPGNESLNVALSPQLGESVNAERIGGIVFSVGPFSAPVEDIIRAHIQQTRSDVGTRPRYIQSAQGVYLLSPAGVRFAAVHVSIGREVKNKLRSPLAKSTFNRGSLSNIKVLLVDSANLVFRLEICHQHKSQHPLSTGHKNPH